VDLISRQCSDTVGWATGRASGLLEAACWYAGGDNLTGALHVLWLQLSPPPSSLAPVESGMETFWYQLTQVQPKTSKFAFETEFTVAEPKRCLFHLTNFHG